MARIDIPNGEELERIRLWKMTSGLSEAIDSFELPLMRRACAESER